MAISPRVSLCMIVKNEASFIEECLWSAQAAVDEMIVVDTGSTDGTVELARGAGAQVFHFDWCDDFAAARNESIRHASGDWVLWLDADERLAPGAAPVIREAVKSPDLDCGYLFLHNAASVKATVDEVLDGRARLSAPVLHPRLLRRTSDLEFSGIVHEQLDEWLRPRVQVGKTRNLAAHFIHLGYAPELRKARDKGDRNLRLLERRAALDPSDFTSYGYLAQEHLELEQVEKAWQAVEDGWRVLLNADPGGRQPALLLVCMRARLQLTRGDLAGARETLRVGRTWVGDHPDLDIFGGLTLLSAALRVATAAEREELLERAADCYRAAIDKSNMAYSQAFLSGSPFVAGQVGLGLVDLAAGTPELAIHCFDAALADAPNLREASLGRAEALVGVGNGAGALQVVEPWLDEGPDGWLIAAAAAEDLGQIAALTSYLRGARERLSVGYASPHRNEQHWALQSRLLAYLGQPRSGEGVFGAVCGVLANEQPRLRASAVSRMERRWIELMVRNLSRAGQGQSLHVLLESDMDLIAPGLSTLVSELCGLRTEGAPA